MNMAVDVTGWVLLHFVWQGAAIAAAIAVLLRGARHGSAQGRYAIACVGLLAMIAAPLVTALVLSHPPTGLAPWTMSRSAVRSVPFDVFASAASINGDSVRGFQLPAIEALFPFLVFAWVAGASVLLLWRWRDWLRVRRAHDAALRLPESRWQHCAQRFAARLGVTVPFRVIELGRVDVPMVVGWLRPIVILPLAVCAAVPPVQIEAVLAHEIAHISRRDYLVNLVQIAAEAILFYHPAVWWISARIRTERELCCDDLAVQLCGDRGTYARALVAVEGLRSGRPQFGVAATDGPLLKRLRRILAPEPSRECSRQSLPIVAATLLAIAIVVAMQTIATASRVVSLPQRELPSTMPAFRTASIATNRSGQLGAAMRPASDGSLEVSNSPLSPLLEFAYGVPAYRIEGLPPWASTMRFDISAQGDGTPASVDHIALMLRGLLIDRFRLSARIDARELPVYELRLDRPDARFGPSLSENTRADCEALARGEMPVGGQRDATPCGVANGWGLIHARGVSSATLAKAIERYVDRPVLDRTNVGALLDADLRFRSSRSPFPVSAGGPAPGDIPADSRTADIFTAVREQLGLRLVPSRDPVDVLVVTSIQPPTSD